MAIPKQIEALLERMRGMSAADISVLEASTQTPVSNMTTGPGSPNGALWSAMVDLGWMLRKDEDLELPGGVRFPMEVYSIRPEGLQPTLNLLATLARR